MYVRYYANIAIGSYSRLCSVHPDFRIIVHTPLSSISRTPLPFLNRFEKYTLSLQVSCVFFACFGLHSLFAASRHICDV